MDLVAQLVANGLVNGSHYALLALGFGLIFGTTRITHFAYGPIYALSAYGCWFAAAPLGAPLWLAVIAGIATGAVAGALAYLVVYRPFEREGSPPLVILIASLGLFIVLENAIGVVFGTDTKVVPAPPAGVFLWGPLVVTSSQLAQVAALVILGAGLALYVRRTRFGKAVLAMTDNPEMARVIGIDTLRVSLAAFVIGSAIAAVPACLILVKDGATAHMGFAAVFMAFVAVVVGGVGSLRGAVAGGLALGLVESTGMVKIPTEWQSSIAFVVLFLVLLFRPRGLFGGRQ
ncbi:MAG TPA: branched-chain amino acid ABC transporter permease [Burkholderiales bacterium]|nr:branched-chain amino acid ABC transporter permease [Burkholderiales bacterium]